MIPSGHNPCHIARLVRRVLVIMTKENMEGSGEAEYSPLGPFVYPILQVGFSPAGFKQGLSPAFLAT